MDGYQVSSCAVTKNNINSVIAKITTKTTDQAESCFKLYFRFSQMDGTRDAQFSILWPLDGICYGTHQLQAENRKSHPAVVVLTLDISFELQS